MPTVQLTDVIDTVVYRDLEPEMDPEKTAWFESGIVVRDPLADDICASSGQTGVLPYWLDLDPDSGPNYSSDQAVASTPDKVSQHDQNTRKSFLNKSYSAMDLARELQRGVDAMQHIRNRFGTWWTRQWQRRLIATTEGIYNANVAGNFEGGATGSSAGDMIVDVTGSGTPGFTRANFNAARFTLGDRADETGAMLVHSVIHQTMVDNDDIDFIQDSQGNPVVAMYMNHIVIVDDSTPVYDMGGGNFDYITTIYGPSAFAYGESDPTVPVEVDRQPEQGHGGGQETLYERKTWLIHPVGHTNLGAAVNGNGLSQTVADLQNAANWARTHQRKNVPIAFLRSRP